MGGLDVTALDRVQNMNSLGDSGGYPLTSRIAVRLPLKLYPVVMLAIGWHWQPGSRGSLQSDAYMEHSKVTKNGFSCSTSSHFDASTWQNKEPGEPLSDRKVPAQDSR